ncbi:hypothetical protein M1E08_15985 [Erwinia sp. PK3-005]|uniref:Uncharacterized protein n=1 Tax=Mixta hanseatica TaxID=2872648 RepID=A0ABY4RBN5_9GAMM|nr:hypothetical protein [Mixta hanseatica]UQY45087.1 hypothetical protein K6958_05240 [Mixta hanseatica]
MFIEKKPDEIALLSFFESEPASFNRDNISYLYTAKDKKGISLNFSFSVVEGWIQYTLMLSDYEFLYNSIDVDSFMIKDDKVGEYLYIEVVTDTLVNKIEIRISPEISIKSSTLIR